MTVYIGSHAFILSALDARSPPHISFQNHMKGIVFMKKFELFFNTPKKLRRLRFIMVMKGGAVDAGQAAAV